MRALGWVWLLACGSGDDGKQDSGETATSSTTTVTDTPGFSSLAVELDACRETAVHVSWSGDEEGVSAVRYGESGALDLTTPDDAGGLDHAFTLRGLINGGTYTVQPMTILSDGTVLEGPAQDVTVPFTPAELFPLVIDEDAVDADRSLVASSHILLSTLGSDASYVGVVDGGSGQFTWWITVEDPEVLATARARMSADGQAILWNDYDRDRVDDLAHIYRTNVDDCDQTTTRTLVAHHDFVEVPDGFGWLGFDYNEKLKVPGYGVLPVVADNIYEAAEGAKEGEERQIWSALSDWECPVYWVGNTMELGGFVPGYHEWTHGNSMGYDADSDAYLILMRYVNSLVKVDRSTGTTLWTMGGVCGDITNAAGAGEPFWSYPHFSHTWMGEDGLFHVLAFDNGDEYQPKASRVVEYAIDETSGIAEEVWSYPHPDGAFIRILGDARRLPNGNTLVAWTPLGVIEEVTEDLDVVWRATSSLGQTVGRMNWVPDIYAGVDGSL
jgi:hypothetical protein